MAGTFEYSNFSLVVPEEPGVPNVLALLPPCARTCSLAQLELFRCLGTDWECICYQNAKDDLFMHFNYCFDGSCPIQDVYAGNRVLYGSCGIEVPPSSGQLLVVSAVLGSIAVLALLLRFMSRMRVFGIRWGIDDWISLLVLPLAILFIILQFVLVHYGLGKDIWTLDNKTIIEVGKYFLIDELAYLTLTIATKISILCFYLRIFHSRNVRIAIFGLIGLLVATLIGFFFSFLFQCRPVQDAWELYGSTDPKVVAHCDVDAWAVIMAFGFCNVVLDLVIMAFPVPILVKLKMGKRKKARVIALSSVGVCITIIAIIRLVYSLSPKNGAQVNFTRAYTNICFWSVVEVNASIICACLPQIDILCRKALGYYRKCPPTTTDTDYEMKCFASTNITLNRLSHATHPDSISFSRHDVQLLEKHDSWSVSRSPVLSIASPSSSHVKAPSGLTCIECKARLLEGRRDDV